MTREDIRSIFNIIITIFIIGIVLAAFILSGAAVFENMRFEKATDQILEPVGLMRSIIAQQPTFAQNQGDDIWTTLARLGRLPAAATHPNPWGSELRAMAVDNGTIRIESDLPTHDCRRMALYFMNQAQGFGLTIMEAQAFGSVVWEPIYPVPVIEAHKDITDIACGNTAAARLGIVFKVR